MRFCRKTMWLTIAVAVLLPVGCASQRGQMASKHEINTAQLLAAARQYEKEGQPEHAAHIYKHVLNFHPTNAAAKEGLALVQEGKLRVEYDTQQLMAAGGTPTRQNAQARELLARQRQTERELVTEQMAELIAQAVKNPTQIDVDAGPTPALIASASPAANPPEPLPAAAVEPKPIPQPPRSAPLNGVSQANAIAPAAASSATDAAPVTAPQQDKIETTAFNTTGEPATAADSPDDKAWREHSLTRRCKDANAAVLAEVRKLESTTDRIRKEGLTQLALMGAEASAAGPAIRQLLDDQNQLVAAHAAWAAWEVDGDSDVAVDALHQLLSSQSSDVAQFAAYTLSKIGEAARPAIPALRRLLECDDRITRLHAAEALSQIADAEIRGEAVDTLLLLLKDDDADVRSLAAMTLGQADSANAEAAVAALVDALDDAADEVRSAAALSLGGYGTTAEAAVARLEEAARKDHTTVREAAQTALDCIKL